MPLALACVTPCATAQKTPKPAVVLPYRALDMPGYSRPMLEAGASLASVHLLDDTHALLTFSLRKLVPRLVGDEGDHQDRLVGAELVELPSGKVLARTEWQFHDHGRYLWSIGKGIFLVRDGDGFFAIAPLMHHGTGDAFRRLAFPHREGQPLGVLRSPDGEVITVETRPPASRSHVIAVGDSPDARQDTRVALDFYRLEGEGRPGAPIHISGAGAIMASQAFFLALDGDGYLWPVDRQRGRWELTFNGLGGAEPRKVTDLLSSCSPRLQWLSRSQFLTLTCRGDGQQLTLTAWGMDGHETWEEPFNDDSEPPVFVPAPAAGRFAVSRVRLSAGSNAPGALQASVLGQELRVYQTESGDMLLKVACDPVFKTGENFDLSADGRRLAVLTREALVLYDLPTLSKKDREQLAEVEAFAPARTSAPVLMSRVAKSNTGDTVAAPTSERTGMAPASNGEIPITNGATAAASATNAAAAADATERSVKPVVTQDAGAAAVSRPTPPAIDADRAVTNNGTDLAADGPRKPPTLLKPGEKAEFQARHSGKSPD